jgi:hypothetical protein
VHPLTDFWRSIETLHSVVYFAPDAKERYEALGLKGYWMGYVASRAGALGSPPAGVVVATFHGFAPRLVERAVPDAWHRADVDAVLAERVAVARDALAPGLEGHDVAALARHLGEITARVDVAGMPLAAAERSLAVPDDAVGGLWRHASVLRELRGDAHVAVLVTAGLSGVAANVLQVAVGRAPARQREVRGWTEEEWAAAAADLRDRGWLDADGVATETGRAARERLEDATDRAVDAAFDVESRAHAVAVEPALLAAARSVVAAGAITFPNPVGAQRP